MTLQVSTRSPFQLLHSGFITGVCNLIVLTLLTGIPACISFSTYFCTLSTWIRVWTNLWSTPVDDRIIGTWYTIIHDIGPTRDRLHVIHLTTDNLCFTCQVQDTLLHRLTECGEGARHWLWIKARRHDAADGSTLHSRLLVSSTTVSCVASTAMEGGAMALGMFCGISMSPRHDVNFARSP
jgi:hypothetical protein